MGEVMFDRLHYAVAIFIACKGREPNSSEFNRLRLIANDSGSLLELARKISEQFGCASLGSVVSNAYTLLLQKPNDKSGISYWVSQRKSPYRTALDIVWVSVNKYSNHPNTRKLISKVESVIRRNQTTHTISHTTKHSFHRSCNPSRYISNPVYWAMLAYWSCKGTRYIPSISIYRDLKRIASRFRSPLGIIREVARKYGCGSYTQVINNFYDMALNKPDDAKGRNYWYMSAVRLALRHPCDLVYYIAKAAVCDYPNNKYTRNMLNLLAHFYNNYEGKLASMKRSVNRQRTYSSNNQTVNQKPNTAYKEQPIVDVNKIEEEQIPEDTTMQPASGESVNQIETQPVNQIGVQSAAVYSPNNTAGQKAIVIDKNTLLIGGAALAALLLLANRD